MSTQPPPSKKRKLEQPNKTPKFTTADQIRQALQNQNQSNPNAIVDVLNQIRNQFTIRSDEGVISPQDERLAIAEQWLTKNPGAQDIFNLWETSNPRQHNLLVSIISVLAALLPLLSSHYTYHALGYPIVKTLLTQQWMRKLNSYIGGAHNELILVTLKLFNAISGFAGGKEKKSLLDAFQWEIKSLPKLLSLRRKGKAEHNPLAKPDIRSLYILFLLSFLDAPTQTKNTFLEQHRDVFSSIFKGLAQDHYIFIRHIFEVVWVHLWSDPKIKRITKIGIFNETTVSNLLKIYDRTTSSDGDMEHVPADLAHHFLLAITTRPGSGICFKDRGWYSREDADDNNNNEKSGKLHNKILANILKTLKVNEDSRQQELARRILEACPELVAGYWSSAQLTLEPRLSTKWITNISFFGTIISLPVPSTSFFLPNTKNSLYNPTPPPLQTILSNILPSDISPKLIFSKGLQSVSGLVQHCTALALAKCLIKYAKVVEAIKGIEEVLEMGDTEEGLWGKRRREVEKEVRKRVPEFQVIVGFSQQKTQSVQQRPKPNLIRGALLQESAQRLLLLYHIHLPEVVAEARFDVGKALTSFMLPANTGDEDGAVKKFNLVQQLHVLQMLKESSNFVWTNKSSNSRTYLYTLLKSYTSSYIPALKSTLLDLLSHLLSNTIFFQETPTEPHLWLLSLPNLVRAPDATSLDQAKLTDEAESVVTFLEDCIQRCLKTPYRYIEDMQKLPASHSPSSSGELNSDVYPSPLVITLVEQLEAKLKIGGLLTPSDVLAIVSFLRKLVFRLSSRVRELMFFEAFVAWVVRVIDAEEGRGWCLEYPQTKMAIRKEMMMMREILNPGELKPSPSNLDFEAYLGEVEGLSIGEKSDEHMIFAHSIIDRLRFTEGVIPAAEIKRLILAVQRHWAPALRDLAQYLPPRSGYLWENHILVGTDVGTPIPAVWLFYDATKEQILDSDYRINFAATFFSGRPSLHSCLELIRLVEHRVRGVDEDETCGLLSLLSVLIRGASLVLKKNDLLTLKENLVARQSIVKQLAMKQHVDGRIRAGLRDMVQDLFNPRSIADRRCISEISAYWLALLQEQLTLGAYDKVGDAAIWVQYLPLEPILHLLDSLTNDDTLLHDHHFSSLLQSILGVIQSSVEDNVVNQNALRERIPRLLKVRKQLLGLRVVDDLLLLSIDSALPLGYSPYQSWDSESELPGSLMTLMERAKICWDQKAQPLGCTLPLADFLDFDTWTPSTPRIISGLIYKQGFDPRQFENWLGSESCSSCSNEALAIILQSALDVHHCLSPNMDSLSANIWVPHFPRITALCFNPSTDAPIRQVSASCIELALDTFADHSEELIGLLRRQVEEDRGSQPTLEAIRLGLRPDVGRILQEWVVHSLIERLAGDMSLSSDTLQLLNAAGQLLRSCDSIKGHQVETALGIVIQHHLSRSSPMRLVIECINHTHLKPVAVNRYIQSILNHPHFYKYTNENNSDPDSRSHIIDLLHVLFNLHPTNTCQITQIEPLLSIYHGTMSKDDIKLFSVFQLFEVQRKTSLAPLFNHWSSSNEVPCSSALDALLSLDAVKVFRTTLQFPKGRKLSIDAIHSNSQYDAQIYDPIFLMLLVHLVLSEYHPTTPFGWIELLRTNVVGLCIRSLSSKDQSVRELGLSLLASLYECIEGLEFQERVHVSYILNLLRDLFPASTIGDTLRRLPSYTTLILAHALRGVFYPSNFIYPLTSRFLLQRPELDANDVPMLYSMLYSPTDEWKKDRGWIVRFLADGMMSSDDWRVLKRRHTWDLLASLFQSSNEDPALRRGIFEVIANLTCNRQATMSMIIKSSFLVWLEMQLVRVDDDEDAKWAKILGNIVLIVDHSKLDSVFKEAWKASIFRCLSILLSRSKDGLILPLVAPSIFRLDQSSTTLVPELEEAVVLATQAVIALKPLCDAVGDSAETESLKLPGFYPSYAIHESDHLSRSYWRWLDCVVLLWRITMKPDHKSRSWDLLTSQLLASQLHGRPKHAEIDWVRKEVVRSLQKYSIC
ncbi:hypothetical protein AGABI2DRAFT_123450 [Agaricus bisporus var. bisporus H97]|uniref:hypothetical protein n=1 Tax=Agaricus bisporus var. bisporus (strain H97 / ATCC MYA-4626 / FGSC 10389) TaxID=936046 RepID=UPI00029F7CAE|nr:hypothetical protein AGABI2DRAFT_123450 [Agaricus bisporus var. bisporus H97]EKV41736.1 hypothetical protein AGABI2DRAFT_123450 [Agaricus bisporus var. bisporus H97]